MKSFVVLALTGALLTTTGAQAQNSAPAAGYPNELIRILVGTAPGGAVDVMARVVADKLATRWGQNVIVENRPGAGGTIAAEQLSRSTPDGYTLFTAHPGPLAATALYKKLGYDPHALQPAAIIAMSPMVFVARKDLQLNSVAELVKFAKANPGKLNFGTSGPGSISHLTTELLLLRTGIDGSRVHYRGAAPAIQALVSGQVDVMAADISTLKPMVEAEKVKVLGTAALKRLPSLPNVPTFEEQGITDFVTTTWFALMAPPGTPRAITDKLNATVVEALQAPDAKPLLESLMVEPLVGGVDEVRKYIDADAKRWTEVIRAAKISMQ